MLVLGMCVCRIDGAEHVVTLKKLAMESMCKRIEQQSSLADRLAIIESLIKDARLPLELIGDAETEGHIKNDDNLLGYLEQSRRWVLEPHQTYLNERKYTTPLCFSPDGVYLALSEPAEFNGDYIVNNSSKRIKVYDVCRKKVLFHYDNFLARSCSVKFVGNKKILFETDDERLQLYDIEKQTRIPLTHQNCVDVVSVNTDGTCIVTGNKSLMLWKITPDEFNRTELKRSYLSYKSAIFSSQGDIIAGNSNGKLYFFDTHQKKCTSRVDLGAGSIDHLAKTADDKKVIVGTTQGSLMLYDRIKNDFCKLAQERDPIKFLHLIKDSNTVVYATNNSVKTVDVTTAQSTVLLNLETERISSIALTPTIQHMVCCIKPIIEDEKHMSALVAIDVHNNVAHRLNYYVGSSHRVAVSDHHIAYNTTPEMVEIHQHSMKWREILKAMPNEVAQAPSGDCDELDSYSDELHDYYMY